MYPGDPIEMQMQIIENHIRNQEPKSLDNPDLLNAIRNTDFAPPKLNNQLELTGDINGSSVQQPGDLEA